MDHLDAVHQGRKRVDDGGGGPTIERLNKPFERIEEFDVVLGFIRCLCDVYVDLYDVEAG